MKTISEFFKNTLVGGFLVLLPSLLMWGVLQQVFRLAMRLVAPIVVLLPKDLFADTAATREMAAFIILFAASFICGLLVRAAFLRRSSGWVERRTLGRVPVYRLIKNLVSEGAQPDSVGFRPAMLLLSDGMQRPAYVIEDHQDGNFTVFLPSAPAAFSGMVHVVSKDKLVFLDVKFRDLVRCVAQYGAGCGALLKQSAARQRAPAQ